MAVAVVRAGAAALGAVGAASWLTLALAHRDDLYRIGFAQGVWLELIRDASHGVLYPPLFDGQHFGGTRYMPLVPMLMGAVARLVHDELLAGRIVTSVFGVLLAALVYRILARERVPFPTRVFLVGVLAILLADDTLTLHGDLPSVVLQLGALALVARSTRTPWLAAAGASCALALFAKATAVWGAAAILVWLLLHARAQVSRFLAAFLLPLAALVTATAIGTDGRFVENMVALGDAGTPPLGTVLRYAAGIEGSPLQRALGYLGATGLVLVVLAALRLALAIAGRRLSIYDVALVPAALVSAAALLDIGATSNHLADVEVVAAVCAGLLAARRGAVSVRDRSALELVLLLVLAWPALVGYQLSLRKPTAEAIHLLAGRADTRYALARLRPLVPQRGDVLSEDPTVPFAAGRRPVVLDPFMLLRIGEQRPDWRAALVRRIERRSFARVYLLGRIDASSRGWYRDCDLGLPVVDAIQRAYRYAGVSQGYATYLPRAGRPV